MTIRFRAYIEQPSSAATCLIANIHSLQSLTSQPSQQTIAPISSDSTVFALLELRFTGSAYIQHMVRERCVFKIFTTFATRAKLSIS